MLAILKRENIAINRVLFSLISSSKLMKMKNLNPTHDYYIYKNIQTMQRHLNYSSNFNLSIVSAVEIL